MASDPKTKTPRVSKSKRAEAKLNSAQQEADRLGKRIDTVEGKQQKLEEQHATLVREHKEALARRDHALSNPDLSDDVRTAGTPGPTGADTPQQTVRDFADIVPAPDGAG